MPSETKSGDLLTSLLRDVSRSFYLTMRILPTPIRRQISLAYLLARTTDTIADTELVDIQSRLQALSALRRRILGLDSAPLAFNQLSAKQGLPAERILLERSEESLSVLSAMNASDCKLIQEVLDVITSGQELDLQRFGTANAGKIVTLKTQEELDDYTYRVAGCVGEFWTKMCAAHLWSGSGVDVGLMITRGIRFGKGLQLVNILRDLPQDLRKGRCYVPEQSLQEARLTAQDLLSAGSEGRFRPLYDQLIAIAEGHLAAGWEYTKSLPKKQFQLRCACAWPALIGIRTLRLLRHENVLDNTRRLKISRLEVHFLRLRSVFLYPFAPAWDAQFVNEMKLIYLPIYSKK